MKKGFTFSTLLASASVCVMAGVANAQAVQPATASDQANRSVDATEGDTVGNDIVVTARLASERAIDVPATVTGLSSTDLQERNVLSLTDVQSVVPGLNLSAGGIGSDAGATFRGVEFDAGAQAGNTVTAYINDVPTSFFQLFNSLYDVGNIEILRGPQGTLRGQSAPSGAIGLVTRRPDLDQFGGYASATVTLPRGVNVQGAVGGPLIRDVLGVRLAGAFNRTNGNRVKSVNNSADPFEQGQNFRATVLFRPTSDIEATVIYRRDDQESQSYGSAVFGSGAPAASAPSIELVPQVPGYLTIPAYSIPANFNGPALNQSANRAVQRFADVVDNVSDSVTAQLGWSFGGQKLFYIGYWGWTTINQQQGADPFNLIPNSQSRGYFNQKFDFRSQEVRLSSEEPVGGIVDYTLGYYHRRDAVNADFASDNVLAMNGAFGSPLGVNSPLTANRDYIVALDFQQRYKSGEDSIFANANFHLGERVQLSLGGRQIWSFASVASPSSTRDTFAAIPFAGPCVGTASGFTPQLGAYNNAPLSPSPYEGTCNVRLTGTNGLFPVASFPLTKLKNDPFVWSGSLSYKITPDLMAYASVGTAVRDGPAVVGAPSCTTCGPYSLLRSETSRGYELGLKGKILDNKLTFSLAAFQQNFKNFISQTQSLPYINTGGTIQYGQFSFNGPMRTRGVDLELDYRASQDLQLGAAFSYARARYRNADVPCNDSNFDGVPDGGPAPATPADWAAAGGPASGPAICRTSGPSASTPPWNLILRGEYSHDAFEDARGFVRWTFNYTPKNTNATLSNPGFEPKAYGIFDIFGGVRSADGAWEASVAVRNLLNDRTILSEGQSTGQFLLAPFSGASSGYRTFSRVLQRSVQFSVRYAFGSR